MLLFHQSIYQHIDIRADPLDGIHAYTKAPSEEELQVSKELLHYIHVFATLKLEVADIKHMTHHKAHYDLGNLRTISQIQRLINHKKLQEAFVKNKLTLPQYVDWLYSSDYSAKKIVSKIADLSNWHQDILEDLKKAEPFASCFSENQNPIDSLVKIKSFTDLVAQSGINSKVLLALKDLGIANGYAEWKTYTEAANHLKLAITDTSKEVK